MTEQGTDHQVAVYEDEYRGIIENSGVEILKLDKQQIATFRNATTPVLEWWKQKVDDPELAEKALKLVRSA